MPTLRDVRNLLFFSHYEEIIEDNEFLMLYELVKPQNRDLPYWTYAPFDLDKLSDDECQEEFRFFKNDIYVLRELLAIPEEIVCYNGTKVNGIEGLCIYLKRFAYPCRYSDMMPRFGRSAQELCLVSNWVMNYIYILSMGGVYDPLTNNGFHQYVLRDFVLLFKMQVLHYKTAGGLLMGLLCSYVGLESFKELYIMVTKEFKRSSINQLWHPMD